ncbi:MAG: hypothetical protein ABI780_09980 [Ardenticatenales bacterium]
MNRSSPTNGRLPRASARRRLVVWMRGPLLWRCALLSAGVALTFPPLILPATATVDGSWVLALNLAAARHLVHGRDMIWTFGPLAPAVLPLDIGANLAWAIPIRLALFAAWWSATARLLARTPGIVAPALLAAAMALASTRETFTAPLLLGCLAWLAVARVERRVWPAAVAAMLAAVVTLVKFNLGLAGGLAIGVWAALRVAARHGAPRAARRAAAEGLAVAAAGAVTLVAAWRLSGAPLGALPIWIADSLRLMAGFSTQLAVKGPAADLWWALLPIGLALLVLAGAAVASHARGLRSADAPNADAPNADAPPAGHRPRALADDVAWAIIVALPLWAVFKSAFVRHDLHAVHWFVTLPGVVALALPRASAAARSSVTPATEPTSVETSAMSTVVPTAAMRTRAVVGLAAFSLALSVGWLAWRVPGGMPWPIGPARIVEALRWPRTRAAVAAQDRATRAAAVAAFGPGFDVPGRVGNATIDAYPWDVAGVALAGLNWTPRYVPQSYQAYDPVLDRRTAAGIEGAARPAYILYRIEAVDDAQPATVDPATWRAIWRWYEIDAHDQADTLLLKRRKRPRFNLLRPLGDGVARLGQPIDVPDAGGRPVLLYGDLAPSLAGRLLAAAFRLAPPEIDVERLDGTHERHRVVWANLVDGILASHMPQWRHQITPLLGRDWTPPPATVRRLTFVADGRWWRSEVRLRWAAVER